jgi:uncharacterized protein YuzE
MKIQYDADADALYLSLGDEAPDGVIEVTEGVNLDTTDAGRLVGIEILDASSKVDLKTLLSYVLELDPAGLGRKAA